MEMVQSVPHSVDIYRVNNWHKANRWFCELGRMRAGITFRYCPTGVKCDLSVWPNFEVYPSRGTDRFQHNPVGKMPTQNAYPATFNQLSSEFA